MGELAALGAPDVDVELPERPSEPWWRLGGSPEPGDIGSGWKHGGMR